MTAYIIISPRGFANETVVRKGSRAAVKTAASIINDEVNAWAEIVPASHPTVRAAKREAARWGEVIETVSEADLGAHRPVYIDNEGHRYAGREPLPA